MFNTPSNSTDSSNAVVPLWFSVACLGVRASVTFHLMCVHIIFLVLFGFLEIVTHSVDHVFSLYFENV